MEDCVNMVKKHLCGYIHRKNDNYEQKTPMDILECGLCKKKYRRKNKSKHDKSLRHFKSVTELEKNIKIMLKDIDLHEINKE